MWEIDHEKVEAFASHTCQFFQLVINAPPRVPRCVAADSWARATAAGQVGAIPRQLCSIPLLLLLLCGMRASRAGNAGQRTRRACVPLKSIAHPVTVLTFAYVQDLFPLLNVWKSHKKVATRLKNYVYSLPSNVRPHIKNQITENRLRKQCCLKTFI